MRAVILTHHVSRWSEGGKGWMMGSSRSADFWWTRQDRSINQRRPAASRVASSTGRQERMRIKAVHIGVKTFNEDTTDLVRIRASSIVCESVLIVNHQVDEAVRAQTWSTQAPW